VRKGVGRRSSRSGIRRPHVVMLAPAFYPYRVPVFDEIARRLDAVGTNFTVLSLATQRKENAALALELGRFDRRLVPGRYIPLSLRDDDGTATPRGVVLSYGLLSLLRSLRPDVVISHNFNLWTLLAQVVHPRVVVVWEGTHHTERTIGRARLALRRAMASRARAFVVNGKLSWQYVRDLGVAEDRIFSGGMCAEPRPEDAQSRFDAPGRTGAAVRFLFVGRLIKLKDAATLLHAARRLRELTDAPFEVRLVGDGPERPALTSLAERLGIADLVTFAGNLPPSSVWAEYDTASVFVLPTLQDNWPLVVPEAMASGLPVILSSGAGSVPDLIESGWNGFVFEPGDVEALSRLMRHYVQDPGLACVHGMQSRRAAAAFTPQSVAAVVLVAIQRARPELIGGDFLASGRP
jgi:glycosyltransferase involved in cell wall biosynthesis